MSREKESKINGLCTTCVHVTACVYCLVRGGDVIYCDMFDDGSGKIGSEETSGRSRISLAVDSRDDEGGKFEGLCANCATRHSCTKPRPAGGVWHCEDYC